MNPAAVQMPGASGSSPCPKSLQARADRASGGRFLGLLLCRCSAPRLQWPSGHQAQMLLLLPSSAAALAWTATSFCGGQRCPTKDIFISAHCAPGPKSLKQTERRPCPPELLPHLCPLLFSSLWPCLFASSRSSLQNCLLSTPQMPSFPTVCP